jgi:dCMP deaminase
MSVCLVAYIPVLHEGYRRLLERHGPDARLFVVGPELYADYRPLAKDIRALPPQLVADSIAAWDMCREASVLTAEGARRLAAECVPIVMPAEDVSYRLAEQFFDRCEVLYDTVFLRWDKTKTAQLLRPRPHRTASHDELIAELAGEAAAAAMRSIDWWRQVGAAIRLPDGEVRSAGNEHNPHRLSAYAAGDPRANFYKGVAIELSTATHAEARLIAQAAREGRSTERALLYVTDFPCPPCAKLVAAAGIARLYFRDGYALLDGNDVLLAAGVEVVQLAES